MFDYVGFVFCSFILLMLNNFCRGIFYMIKCIYLFEDVLLVDVYVYIVK